MFHSCGQPLPGLLQRERCEEDEKLIREIKNSQQKSKREERERRERRRKRREEKMRREELERGEEERGAEETIKIITATPSPPPYTQQQTQRQQQQQEEENGILYLFDSRPVVNAMANTISKGGMCRKGALLQSDSPRLDVCLVLSQEEVKEQKKVIQGVGCGTWVHTHTPQHTHTHTHMYMHNITKERESLLILFIPN